MPVRGVLELGSTRAPLLEPCPDPFRENVGVGHDTNETPAFLQTSCNIAKHVLDFVLALKRVMHTEHHGDDVEASSTKATDGSTPNIRINANFSNDTNITNPLPEAVLSDETGIKDRSPSTSHLSIPIFRLLNRGCGRIETDI